MMLKHQPLISDVFSVEIGSEHLNQVQAKTTANCRIYYYLYIMHDYQYKFQVSSHDLLIFCTKRCLFTSLLSHLSFDQLNLSGFFKLFIYIYRHIHIRYLHVPNIPLVN